MISRGRGVIALAALAAACSSFGSDDSNDGVGSPPGPLQAADGGSDGAACEGDGCLRVLASGEDGASEVVADGAEIYWTIGKPGSGEIRRCTVSSCAPTSLATGQDSPRSLVVDGAYVLWASGDAVGRVPADGSRPAEVYYRNGGGQRIRSFRRAGGYLVLAVGNGFTRCDVESDSCTFSSTLTPATDSEPGPVALDPATAELVWGASKKSLYKVHPLAELVRAWPLANVRALVANETTIFAITEDSADVFAIGTNAPLTDAPKAVATASRPYALALHGAYVYIADFDGSILRVPAVANGGSPRVLATGLAGPKSIAVTAERIFVVLSDGRIVSLASPA